MFNVDLKSLDLTEDTRNIKMYTDYFLKYMNATAKELGMKETVFVNPHGMDAVGRMEAYSIVEDLALLTKAMLDYPEC